VLPWGAPAAGPGDPPGPGPRIFERFERASIPAGYDGFGLGLSVVTAIAHAHGGTAWVDEAPGGGARFAITVPAVRRATDLDDLTREG
jgi:signal transduction histidine kinase